MISLPVEPDEGADAGFFVRRFLLLLLLLLF
jgi:hypothetical protein